ncbi:multidrug resistance-associated protein 4-like isoform X2 [Photinus pyralis]|uniref:multidrug resistance-associated protein 4-like isoform X2 n=1 Tax=Photinus pyralis TaxID=7054 RepID=UPI0012673E2F|nr:multidrug resistance-associated protein 4-like isoform X2 [Photinus pyralis]XP_031345264.1 multidrug resistance-associated protein 4-like isoform X2 [Photinus pyralis]
MEQKTFSCKSTFENVRCTDNGEPNCDNARRIGSSVRLSQPILLGELLGYYSSQRSKSYLYAIGLILCTAFSCLTTTPTTLRYMEIGMKVRVACTSLIYRKAIRLSKTGLGKTTVGQMINLASNDVARFDVFCQFSTYLLTTPLQVIIGSYLMYKEVGISAICGVAVIIFYIPIQLFSSKIVAKLRIKATQKTDERIRLMNEIISGIQLVKMYAWEKPFAKFVSTARRHEIKLIKAASCVRIAVLAMNPISPLLCLLVSVLACIALNESVTAKKIYVLISYFGILRKSACTIFPQAAFQTAEITVVFKRLNRFLSLEERMPVSLMNQNSNQTVQTKDVIFIQNGLARWNESPTSFELKDVNIKIKPRATVAIIGPVGSGKSSTLQLLLQELPLAEGRLQIHGSLSYASQDPWVFNGTIRQNILFNHPYSKERYENVISKCSLKTDFAQFENADMTIVGERGITLSGGQRARISLARAIYRDADIYLLDDPLAAVDAEVGREIFKNCITDFLQKKTVILVTNHLQLLQDVDSIIILENGRVKAQDTFSKLQESGLEFAKLLQLHGKEEEKALTKSNVVKPLSVHKLITSTDENKSTGAISRHVYRKYICAGSHLLVVVFVLSLFVVLQSIISFSEVFMAHWVITAEKSSDRYENYPSNETTRDFWNFSRSTYIYSYTGIIILVIIVAITRNLSFVILCVRSSTRLHYNMFNSILRGTMRFFNLNSSGRILNRFSKDMGTIDDTLPSITMHAIHMIFTLIGTIIVISSATPWFLVPIAVLIFLFLSLASLYLLTSRKAKRLEGITKSSVFGHINSSIQGLTTIRAFTAESKLIDEFDKHQDLHSAAWFLFISSSQAFGYYLDVVCLIFVCTIIFGSMYFVSFIHGATVGLVITQALGFVNLFQWATRQNVEMENQMIAVERILEYNDIEHERASEGVPPDTWPSSGKIEFVNVNLYYFPDEPPVLKNLSFTIEPLDKVGIVGRTGAGKSSLINALFQLADTSGLITIDGLDVKEMNLQDFRSKLSIIPQEPVLFLGTLRRNLDPLDKYTDDALWKSLEDVELKKVIEDLGFGLNSLVSAEGSNLSVGQRQLICLARAILNYNKLLVIDEATANVDPCTDSLIQKTIRKQFSQCTVLTIAHRLNTIIDSDKIMVIHEGTVSEFGHPHILLQNPSGAFYQMVSQTGMAKALFEQAEENYNRMEERTSKM